MARFFEMCFNVFLVVLIFGGTNGLPFKEAYILDIVHYNDFHARFEETSVDTPTCRYNNNSCLGGFPRLFHEIQVLLQEKPHALLLNAGDSFQGTYWYNLLKWNITQQFMNLLPHDAHAIGNHEFDDGPKGLAPYVRNLMAPVLVANIDVSKEPSLQGLFKPSIVVERKGRKIGIIGLITTDTKILSNAGPVEFTDPFEASKVEAEKLTSEGVDIIVLLSHCGLDVDKKLAKDYGQYIDIIIGGHTHSLLWNGSPAPSGEKIEGTYPVFIQSSADQSHTVLIVQASAFTKYLGNLTVGFDNHGKYLFWEGNPIFLNRSLPEDTDIKAMLAPYAELVRSAEDIPLGENKEALPKTDCVYGECAIGDMLCDAMNDFARENVRSELDYLAFMQRGNIKSSIMAGNVTQGNVFETLPYNDRVESFQLPGKSVLKALERSVSEAWDYHPFKGPWVLQVSGLKVTYNMSKKEGHRVISVLVGNDSKPLEVKEYYQVTAPAYLAQGGDGFTMFKEGKRNTVIVARDQEILERYIRDNSPLDIATDGRIIINQVPSEPDRIVINQVPSEPCEVRKCESKEVK